MADCIGNLDALATVVANHRLPDASRTEAALQISDLCMTSSKKLGDDIVDFLAPTVMEIIASGKGKQPATPELIAACSSIRLTSPSMFFATSPNRDDFPWPAKDEESQMAIARGLTRLMSSKESALQAGAFLSASMLAWTDQTMCPALHEEWEDVALATRVLNAAALQSDGLIHSAGVCACATTAACMLGRIVVLERGARGPTGYSSLLCADETLDCGIAESIVKVLKSLVPTLNEQNVNPLIVHCIYQLSFLIEALGGASAPLREIFVRAGVAEPLVEVMDSDASFGSFAVSVRGTLALGALFGPDGNAPDNLDIHLDIVQAKRVCQFFADSLLGILPATPWLIARDISKLAKDPQNRANLKAAGALQLLAKGVQGPEDASIFKAAVSEHTLQNLILTERWSARALTGLCVEEAPKTSKKLPVLWNPCSSLGLFCGLYAVVAACYETQANQACIASLLGAAFNTLFPLAECQCPFGDLYVTLTDMVVFGIAPAMIMFHSLYSNSLPYMLSVTTTFCYIAALGIRLAHSKATPSSSRFVHGLPSNVAALVMVASAVTFPRFENPNFLPAGLVASLLGIGVSLLSSLGMVSTFRQRNFLSDFNLRQAAQAVFVVGVATLPVSVLPPEQVMLAAAPLCVAFVFLHRQQKESLLVLLLVCGLLVAALSLFSHMSNIDDQASKQIFAMVLVIWEPFTRIATFAAFLKVKSAQKVLATHWVRQVTGLDFHHFHLGVLLLILTIAIRPFIVSTACLRVLAIFRGIGLSYVLDQAMPVVVKTFGTDKHLAVRPCTACGRKLCPWRWGNRGLCYFSHEGTISAVVLHAIAAWYVLSV